MDLVKLKLPDRKQKGFQVALVDDPAIESDFHAFNNNNKFKIISTERRIVMGYAMIADKKIPRYDEKAKRYYTVLFDKDSIDTIVQNFKINNLTTNTNEMHQTNEFANGVYVLWDWQVDSKIGIVPPAGFKVEADGSWFMAMRIENEDVWKKVMTGEYRGFSIEGMFIEEQVGDSALRKLEEDLKMITQNAA